MPTDSWRETVEVDAPLGDVLATVRDVASQPQWIPEVLEAEVVERTDTGLPAIARFAASTAVGTDRYTLAYEHAPAGMSWHLVRGRLQTGQEGVYRLEPLGPARTRVTFSLTVHHNLPLPGFVRRRVIRGLVRSTVDGLVGRVSGADDEVG